MSVAFFYYALHVGPLGPYDSASHLELPLVLNLDLEPARVLDVLIVLLVEGLSVFSSEAIRAVVLCLHMWVLLERLRGIEALSLCLKIGHALRWQALRRRHLLLVTKVISFLRQLEALLEHLGLYGLLLHHQMRLLLLWVKVLNLALEYLVIVVSSTVWGILEINYFRLELTLKRIFLVIGLFLRFKGF